MSKLRITIEECKVCLVEVNYFSIQNKEKAHIRTNS